MPNGLSVTQQGVGVAQALDAQRIADSRWRYFEIVYERILSLGTITSGESVDVFTHGVGFLPAFSCYNLNTGEYLTGNTTGGLRSDEQKVFFAGTFDATGLSSTQVLLRVYNVPMSEEYAAPIEKTFPVKSSTPSRFGVKITPGDIDAFELSTFTVNTTGKTLAIQKTGTVLANSGTGNKATITHSLGLPPTYLTAECDARLTYITPFNPSFVPVISEANGETLTFSGAQSVLIGTFAYIIFKELADVAI